MISPIRKKAARDCGAACPPSFMSSHISLISNPRPPEISSADWQFAHLFPRGNQRGKRNQFTTFTLLPDIINRLFVFFCYFLRHFFSLLCDSPAQILMPDLTSISPSFVPPILTIPSINFFLLKDELLLLL